MLGTIENEGVTFHEITLGYAESEKMLAERKCQPKENLIQRSSVRFQSYLFDLAVLRLLMAVDIAFPSEFFVAFVARKKKTFLVDSLHVGFQISEKNWKVKFHF